MYNCQINPVVVFIDQKNKINRSDGLPNRLSRLTPSGPGFLKDHMP